MKNFNIPGKPCSDINQQIAHLLAIFLSRNIFLVSMVLFPCKIIPLNCIAHIYCARFSRHHERVHVQNVRDFPQTKQDSEINAFFFFLLNEHGDPDFFQIFAKNSQIKKTFEREKNV